MEIILLIIAGIVMYYLYNGFKEYSKNPYTRDEPDYRREYNPSESPYIEPTPKEKMQKTEFGILAGILHNIAKSDGEICHLEKKLLDSMLDDMAKEMVDYYSFDEARELLNEILESDDRDLDDLARDFENHTKGEYKKRLKVVEFLLALAYADEKLSDIEREKIIDVAAIFELNNDDFNKIYDDFETLNLTDIEMSEERAREILNLGESYSKEEIESAYNEALKSSNQNILSPKNLNKNFRDNSFASLREIERAREILNANLDSK